MAQLDFYLGQKIFLKLRLEAPEISLGRGEDCTIQLPDNRVSRVHAILRRMDERHTLEDTSRNGTFVNDQRLEGTRTLEPGDRIQIETFALVYRDDVLIEPGGKPTARQL